MIQISEEEYERIKAREQLLHDVLRAFVLLRGQETDLGVWALRLEHTELRRVPPVSSIETWQDEGRRELVVVVRTTAAPRTAPGRDQIR